MPFSCANATSLSAPLKSNTPGSGSIASHFISFSGVSWLNCVETVLAYAGSSRPAALTATPTTRSVWRSVFGKLAADPGGVLYFGNSMIVTPIAEVVARAASHECWVSARLDPETAMASLTPGSSIPQVFDHLADRNLDLLARHRDTLVGPGATRFHYRRAASHECWVSARLDPATAMASLTPGSSIPQVFDHLADRNLDLIRRYADDLVAEARTSFPHAEPDGQVVD